MCHLVVQRKIIRKVNDNDDGRAVMMFRRRCFVFVVVQAVIQARGISGALVVLNKGDGSIVLEIALEIVRALFNDGSLCSVSAFAFAVARSVCRYLLNTPERSGGRMR